MYWPFLLFLDHCKTVHYDPFFAKWGRTVLQYGRRITQRLWTEVGIFHGHADGAVAEKLPHHRKGNALHDQLTGEGVP